MIRKNFQIRNPAEENRTLIFCATSRCNSHYTTTGVIKSAQERKNSIFALHFWAKEIGLLFNPTFKGTLSLKYWHCLVRIIKRRSNTRFKIYESFSR